MEKKLIQDQFRLADYAGHVLELHHRWSNATVLISEKYEQGKSKK